MPIDGSETSTSALNASNRDAGIFFAFPDGVFHYVCAECDARCCRAGGGFAGSLRREMPALLQLYPALAGTAIRRERDLLTFANPNDSGCSFLRDDNRCRIETDHGKALKPGVCSLFPFNVFHRIGRTLVVSPHLRFNCPLRVVVPAAPGRVEGTHADLVPAVWDSGLVDPRRLSDVDPLRLDPSMGAAAVLAREEQFRDQCAASLGRKRFSAALAEAAADPEAFNDSFERACRLLLLEPRASPGPPDELDETFLAIASTLRLGLLRLPSEAILLTLALAERAARSLQALSGSFPSPSGAVHLLDSLLPGLALAGRGTSPLRLSLRASRKAPPFGDPRMTFAAIKIIRAADGSRPALDILEAALVSVPARADRTALLTQLGPRFQ